MITKKISYIVTCDRCGKTWENTECVDSPATYGDIYSVAFTDELRASGIPLKSGHVCKECYKEFCRLAHSFFDGNDKKGGEG